MAKRAVITKPKFSWKVFGIGIGIGLVILAVFFVGKTIFQKTNSTKPDPFVANYIPPEATRPDGFKIAPQKQILTGEKSVKVPILMYHYIEYNKDPGDTIRHGLTVNPYWFEKQLLALKTAGYETITFDDLYKILSDPKYIIHNTKYIILTFDDGYRDFYTDAWPLLKKYNMKATAYIITDFLNRPNYMDTWMVQRLATDSAGLITIGSHTLNHPALPSLLPHKAYDEIAGSKDRLEKIIGIKVNDFCYPYGAFNQANVDMVKSAGYLTATTTLPGTTHSLGGVLELRRIRIGNYDGESFLKRLTIP